MAAGQLRQTHFVDTPAAVADAAVKRRLADNIAGQANRAGVETFGQRHAAAFGFVAHRTDREMLAQRRAAAVVHEAGCGADVGVAIALDVFFDEIDEARVALQQAEQLECRVRARFLQRGRRLRCGSRCSGRSGGRNRCRCRARGSGATLTQAQHPGGEFAIAEDAEKRTDGK